jgi:hypothetical protein
MGVGGQSNDPTALPRERPGTQYNEERWHKRIKLCVTCSLIVHVVFGLCFVEKRNALKPYSVVLGM